MPSLRCLLRGSSKRVQTLTSCVNATTRVSDVVNQFVNIRHLSYANIQYTFTLHMNLLKHNMYPFLLSWTAQLMTLSLSAVIKSPFDKNKDKDRDGDGDG